MNKMIMIPIAVVVVLLSGGGLILLSSDDDNIAEQSAQTNPDTQTESEDTGMNFASKDTSVNVTSNLRQRARNIESCGYTETATLGPYYLSGSPLLQDGNLNYDNLSGEQTVIAGYVYGSEDKSNPISGATVEIWHADSEGIYYPETSGDVSDYGEDAVKLRGYVTTDETGYYEFSTIFPGEYTGRVRHIHIRTSAEGYQVLSTQIITPREGDVISAEDDSLAQRLNLDCAAPELQDVDGALYGAFNIYLP